MPLTIYDFPTTVRPREVTWSLVPNSQVVSSVFTGHDKIISLPGTRWTADLAFGPLTKSERAILRAFLAQLDGPTGLFSLWDHSVELPRGEAQNLSVTPTIYNLNDVDNTGTILWTNGWGGAYTGLLHRGDYIAFEAKSTGNLSQLTQLHVVVGGYEVSDAGLGSATDDVNSYATTIGGVEADNYAAIRIAPGIRVTPEEGQEVYYGFQECRCIMRLAVGTNMAVTSRSQYDGEILFSCQEYLQDV